MYSDLCRVACVMFTIMIIMIILYIHLFFIYLYIHLFISFLHCACNCYYCYLMYCKDYVMLYSLLICRIKLKKKTLPDLIWIDENEHVKINQYINRGVCFERVDCNSIQFVLLFLTLSFFTGFHAVSLPTRKRTVLNPNLIRKEWMKTHFADVFLQYANEKSHLFIVICLLSSL